MLNLLQTGTKSLHNIWMLGDSEQAETKQLTSSGLVTDRPCLLLECGGSYVTESEYISPTSHYDRYSLWSDESDIYDGDTGTYGSTQVSSDVWSSFIELSLADSVLCSGVRFYATFISNLINEIDLEYWDGSGWVGIYTGAYLDGVGVTKSIVPVVNIDTVQVRFYNDFFATIGVAFFELEFIRRKVFDVTIYDGFDNTGEAKHRIVLSSTGNDFKRFKQPVYFANGLYVEFVESVGECFIRYKEVGR